MTKTENLRIWLADKGYSFTGEHLVADKDFLYPILCVKGGTPHHLTMTEAYAGLLLEHDPLWDQYLTRQMQRVRIRVDGLIRSGKETAREEIEHLEELYAALAARKEKLHEHGAGN